MKSHIWTEYWSSFTRSWI